MRRLIYLALVVCALVTISCKEQAHSVEMHDIKTDTWSTSEEFSYNNADSLSKRDISIVVRYGNGYTADSVSLRILAISPDSLVRQRSSRYAYHASRRYAPRNRHSSIARMWSWAVVASISSTSRPTPLSRA